MAVNLETIQALRAALHHTPENLALRKHLAELLLEYGDYGDAEKELREALSVAPEDTEIRILLAEAFFQQERQSEALVILEELLHNGDVPADAYMLAAHTYLEVGDAEQSAWCYRKAIEKDPSFYDANLEMRLNIDTDHEMVASTSAEEESRYGSSRRTVRGGDPAPVSAPPSDDRPERTLATFAEVAGLDEAKDAIRRLFLQPIQNDGLHRNRRSTAGGGLLLYGPPGCGKTHIARAIAGESPAAFIAVTPHQIFEGRDSSPERGLHELFEIARQQAPCVLFLDEVDVFGAAREESSGAAARLTSQLLAELDHIFSDNHGVLVLAATNRPWHLDPALLREGRFGHQIYVGPPDATVRHQHLTRLLAGVSPEPLDVRRLVRKTRHFSPAELRAVLERARMARMIPGLTRRSSAIPTLADLLAAVRRMRPAWPDWKSLAREFDWHDRLSNG